MARFGPGLTFADASSDIVDHGSATILDDISAGTLMMWALVNTAGTAFREFAGKGTPVQFFKRASGGGNRLAMAIARATANQGVDLTTALATGVHCIAFSWDLNGSPHAYQGTLTATIALSETSPAAGSGAKTTDAASSFTIGRGASASTAVPWTIAWAGLWNRQLSLQEIQNQQYAPHVTSGCVLFSPYGENGVGTQADWSGEGNVGTVTTATVGTVEWPGAGSGALLEGFRNRLAVLA